jgi:hypothetical protein
MLVAGTIVGPHLQAWAWRFKAVLMWHKSLLVPRLLQLSVSITIGALGSDVNKAWRVKAKASTHKAKTKAKVTVFWPEAKAKAKAKASTHKAKTKAKVTVFWPEAKAKAKAKA